MPDYVITFARSARRELEALGPELGARVLNRLERLSREPRPPGSKKLQGASRLWRLRVGDYRVVYAVDDRQRAVDIVRVRHRSEVYL